MTAFCGTANAARKAGAKVSDEAITTIFLDDFIGQAESVVNVAARYNFSDNYSSLNKGTREILKEVASNLAAIYAIQYDLSGFTSRIEAEDMINVLRDAALRGLKMLKDKKAVDFIIGKSG